MITHSKHYFRCITTTIRMIFSRQNVIGSLNFTLCCIFGHSENIIEAIIVYWHLSVSEVHLGKAIIRVIKSKKTIKEHPNNEKRYK